MGAFFDPSSIGLGGRGFLGDLAGSAWVAQVSPLAGGSLQGVAYGNGGWVAIGNTGITTAPRTLTSSDGKTWTLHTPTGLGGGAYGGQGVYFTGNAFFTCDGNNALVRSTDGLTWSTVIAGGSQLFFNLPLAFDGTTYGLADNTSGNLTVWSSPDGVTWTKGTRNALIQLETNMVWGVGPGGGNAWMAIAHSGTADVLAWAATITAAAWTIGTAQAAGASSGNDNGLNISSHGLMNVGISPIDVSLPAADAWAATNPPVGVGGIGGAWVDTATGNICLLGATPQNKPAACFSKDGGATWGPAELMPNWKGFANSDGPVGFGNGLWVAVSSQGEIATHAEAP